MACLLNALASVMLRSLMHVQSYLSVSLFPIASESKSSLVLRMNTEKKIGTPYFSNEEVFGGVGCPSFQPFSSSVFSFPDLVRNNNYESHVEVVPKQSHQSHYPNLPPELAIRSSQLNQSGFHQVFHHQTTSGNTTNPNYATCRESQAISGISLFTDCQARHREEREESLKSKTTGLELSSINTSEDNSFPTWGELTGAEHRGGYHSLSAWMGTSAVNTSLQSGGGASGKQRIRWTHELHEQFVEAVNSLGGAMKATPKGILKLMKSPGLTIFHIKSHLQKYRTAKCIPSYLEGRSGRRSSHDGMPLSNIKGNGGFHISEALCLQMDIQKSLHEHLEFQKKLQMRIEEHANYLQQMFDQQKKSCSFFENHNSDKAIDPSLAEHSSTRVYENHGEIFLSKPKP